MGRRKKDAFRALVTELERVANSHPECLPGAPDRSAELRALQVLQDALTGALDEPEDDDATRASSVGVDR